MITEEKLTALTERVGRLEENLNKTLNALRTLMEQAAARDDARAERQAAAWDTSVVSSESITQANQGIDRHRNRVENLGERQTQALERIVELLQESK